MKGFKLFISISLVIILLLCIPIGSISASTTDSSSEQNSGLILDGVERLGSTADGQTLGLPSSYDLRQDNIFTPTKDQGQSNLCWSFSSAGAVEQYFSKNYGRKIDISETHGAVALSNSVNFISSSQGYYVNNADNGGFFSKAFQYFTNWNSPIFQYNTVFWDSTVLEKNYPFNKLVLGNRTNADNSFFNSESILNVTSGHYVEIRDHVAVKQAIMQNGGVLTGVASINTCFSTDENGEINYITDPNTFTTPTHAIELVGWDDGYSHLNFNDNYQPVSDGAWLVRNSYANRQYYWISYSDLSLMHTDNAAFTVDGIQKATDSEYMLSYDYLPILNNNNFVFRNQDVYLCNVYDVSQYTDDYEQISKVMFYLRTTGCTYDVKIVQLNSDGTLPNNLNNYSSLASGQYMGEGYFTAELNNPFVFTTNNKCAVIIKLSPLTSSSKIFIPYEGRGIGNLFFGNPYIATGESFFGTVDDNNSISWNDCSVNEEYGINKGKGNLVIRPVLSKQNVEPLNVTVTPDSIVQSNEDVLIQVNQMDKLFNVHTSSNYILREDIDYTVVENGIVLDKDYISSLNGQYSEVVLEFNDNAARTVRVNPKSTIDSITISGEPIVGDTLTANCEGTPHRENYDLNYQWQTSINNINWYDIANANSSAYTISDNDFARYIRVKVTSKRLGNVVYPLEKYSEKTNCKTVVLGDVDLDGIVQIGDATLLCQYISNNTSLSERQRLASDVNKDGVIDINDASEIQRIVANN